MSDYQVLDYAAAMDRVDGDAELFFELIDMFFEDYEATLANLSSSVQSNSFKEIEASAHAMKSALGNLGGMIAYQAAYELEKAGRAGEPEALVEKLNVLKTAVADFKAAAEEKR